MSGQGQRGNRGSGREQQSQPRRMMGRGPHGMGGGRIEKAKDVRGTLSRLILEWPSIMPYWLGTWMNLCE
jgi:hypothetical protein